MAKYLDEMKRNTPCGGAEEITDQLSAHTPR